jgi:alkylation response protein AidB-like acyl-CoA dehydrogenase
LVRTGTVEERHKGITFLLASMESPGLEWRAIRQLTGDRHFGELYLEDVRVPVDQRVGSEGEGWRIVTHSLAHERMMSGNGAAPVRARFDALRELASRHDPTPSQRQELARLDARVFTLAGLQARALALAASEAPQYPAWASAMKVLASEIRIEIAQLATDILGPRALVVGPGMDGTASFADGDPAALWAYELLDATAGPIYAGTNEIQRNIIAEVGLGLPR